MGSRNRPVRNRPGVLRTVLTLCAVLTLGLLGRCAKSSKPKATRPSGIEGVWRIDTSRLGELSDVKGASQRPTGSFNSLFADDSPRALALRAYRHQAKVTTITIGQRTFRYAAGKKVHTLRYRKQKRSPDTWLLTVEEKRGPVQITAVVKGSQLTLKRANGATVMVLTRK